MRDRCARITASLVAAGSTICILMLTGLPAHGFAQEIDPLQVEAQVGLPVRLRIPSIKVNSVIEYVGVTSSGAMDVPKKDLNVGWYSPGTRPGEPGSAVIAGHYSWRNHAQGGIFNNLDQLRKGDILYIDDVQGNTLTFVVRENRIFKYDADARQVFSSSSGTRLNLITCAGWWDSSKQSSTSRRVVFTELVPQIPTNFS
ncbi:MAG: class F sortase [Ilumatobacteraceae bacterium]